MMQLIGKPAMYFFAGGSRASPVAIRSSPFAIRDSFLGRLTLRRASVLDVLPATVTLEFPFLVKGRQKIRRAEVL
jgi:hypothetical protein